MCANGKREKTVAVEASNWETGSQFFNKRTAEVWIQKMAAAEEVL